MATEIPQNREPGGAVKQQRLEEIAQLELCSTILAKDCPGAMLELNLMTDKIQKINMDLRIYI